MAVNGRNPYAVIRDPITDYGLPITDYRLPITEMEVVDGCSE